MQQMTVRSDFMGTDTMCEVSPQGWEPTSDKCGECTHANYKWFQTYTLQVVQ